MTDFLMKPKIDFAFKEIMMNEQARVGFLSAMLGLDPSDIRETKILNTNLRKEHKDDKLGILDVRVLLNDDTEIDIEIQLSPLGVWADRSLFYTAKMYTEQIHAGEDYSSFKKCVSISVLDFKLFGDELGFYSRFHISEDTKRILYTDKMEFHVLELPKLPEELKEGASDVLLWAKFINAERKEEFDMLASRNKYIESAYEQLQVISQSAEKRLEYEAREKAIRDHNQMMYEARREGLKQGREEGREEGREAGREEGREEGQRKGREEGIEALILDNLDEGFAKDKILTKLQRRFNLTEEQAGQYFDRFTK
ncbi:Rpn family recombination-promoting nuclease/putative transposase [Clostridiales bacterium]|nr:Rpn family recombination-promoting nuclease/putative transposase [Clostridiales bacterium]